VSKLPQVGGTRLLRALTRAGFREVHRKGSHVMVVHRNDPTRIAVVPVHKGKTLPPGTMRAVLKGAAMTVEARGEGVQRALGELISCPICSGTWIAAALVYGLNLFPGPGRILVTIMGAIGMGEVLHALTEQLSWSATLARKQVGKSS